MPGQSLSQRAVSGMQQPLFFLERGNRQNFRVLPIPYPQLRMNFIKQHFIFSPLSHSGRGSMWISVSFLYEASYYNNNLQTLSEDPKVCFMTIRPMSVPINN